MSPELTLLGYIAWTLSLVFALEVWRLYLSVVKGRKASSFSTDGSDTSAAMSRLCAAYYNCAENFPVFGGLLLLASFKQWDELTLNLGAVFLIARIVQSIAHISSGSEVAITVRAGAYITQLGIGVYWLVSSVGYVSSLA